MIVEDNGDGISKIKLDEINKQLNNDRIESNNIGLLNVHRRLKLLYGEKYGLLIKSEENIGTIVTIKIPKTGDSK